MKKSLRVGDILKGPSQLDDQVHHPHRIVVNGQPTD